MADVIDFQSRKKEMQIKDKNDHIKLSEWLNVFHDDEELRTVFINMDLAMKYIHNKGYCIKSFDPKDIEILNNSLKQIKYNTVLEMPNNIYDQKELVKEDIYCLVFLQIGIYTKCLVYLKPKFLKENFNSFATFLPEGDVPYYRGIIERGASVYFSEYVVEKKKRDLQALENEVGGVSTNTNINFKSNERGKSLVKSNGRGFGDYGLLDENSQINDSIYSQLNRKEAAFVHFILLPMLLFVLGLVAIIIVYMFSFL